MTPDEVARQARVEVTDVEQWAELGLLVRDGEGGLAPDAVGRARILRLAARRGMDFEQIAVASAREGDLLGRFVDMVEPDPGPVFSLDEAASETGLDRVFLERVATAVGLSDGDLTTDDLTAMRTAGLALEAGMPEPALLQLLRVYADALGRVADAESRLFHFYVHDRLRAEGVEPAEAAAITDQATSQLLALAEPSVLYFHRTAMQRALREDVLFHLADDLAPRGVPGQLPIAVLFVDLAAFTSLTDVMGDEVAAGVLDRFSALVRDEALHCDGRVVKQIGDEFMIVFPDPRTAVAYALHLAEASSRETDFPGLRIGVHAGSALYREADYLGATVNIAARVTALAGRGQLIVTGAVHRQAADLVDVWDSLGAQQLKGVSDPVDLHVTALSIAPHPIDPVCGMVVDPATAVIGDGPERFCSVACRDRFASGAR